MNGFTNNRKSPTSPVVPSRPSNQSLGRSSSRPSTPSGLRETAAANSSASGLEPPSGIAYRQFVSTWTDGHVAQWLNEAKCSKVVPMFRANHIRGDVVLDLEQNVLKEMGITSVGDRIKIMSAVKALRVRCSRAGAVSANPRFLLNNGQDGAMPSPRLGGSTNLRRVNRDIPRSPALRAYRLAPTSPPVDQSPPNNRTSSGGGRRSDRPPPLHIHHSTQRDLPQIISGNSANGVYTANLAPPASAKSVVTPRPNVQSLQTPTTGSASSGREKESNSRQYSALPPLPRGQPGSTGASSSTNSGSRSGRSLHPTHSRDQSQSHSPAPDYANNPLPPPPSSSSNVWPGDYGLPKGPAPGNLAGGVYASASGRASPGPHARSTASRSDRDRDREQNLNHKKSGSMGNAVGNLIAGLKGSTWSASSHPYANASAPNEGDDQSSNNTGYKVGRGPFGKPGHHQQASSGNPLSIEDVKRRTIKVSLGEPGQTKLTRTIDISDCQTGMDVLHTTLKKFGKNAGINYSGGDDDFSGETDQGGLVLERTATARQSIFRGNTGPNSKRMSTISALSNGIGGGSDDGGRRSISSNRHRSRFSVSSNGSALTPAQALAAANNPNIPPVPSPPLPAHLKPQSTRPRVSIEEPLPRMSVSTEDGKSVDLNSDEDAPPPTPHILPPVTLGGETLSESLSADFARLPLLQGSMNNNNKRTSFLQELRSKRDMSDTASMLTLDEITEKVESRRQSMMGVGTSEYGDDDASDDLSLRQSTAIEEEEYEDEDEEEEEEEEEETIVEDEEDEDEDEDEEDEEYDDDGMPKKTTSTGDKRVIKWVKGALIGSGSFGSVYLGMDAQQGLLMAVKQVSLPTGNSANEERKKSMLSALEREIDLLKQLQHEHIVQYLDSSVDHQYLNIFLEYVPGGSITTLLKNYGAFEESLVKIWVKQILMGLNYLHEKGIIHRDIKGANILVDNRGGIKISDFGISKKIEDVDVFSAGARGHRASLQGSVFWMAPEVVKQSGHTAKADIWSVGCVIVEMLTGEHPFPKASQMQAIFRIGSYAKPDTPPDITPEAEDFLAKTFEIDHDLRPSATELLQHPWQTMP
ncbi:ATP binding [Tulasnella sp. 417]|nr:ATP binding [Tulasnella sp. 417]